MGTSFPTSISVGQPWIWMSVLFQKCCTVFPPSFNSVLSILFQSHRSNVQSSCMSDPLRLLSLILCMTFLKKTSSQTDLCHCLTASPCPAVWGPELPLVTNRCLCWLWTSVLADLCEGQIHRKSQNILVWILQHTLSRVFLYSILVRCCFNRVNPYVESESKEMVNKNTVKGAA